MKTNEIIVKKIKKKSCEDENNINLVADHQPNLFLDFIDKDQDAPEVIPKILEFVNNDFKFEDEKRSIFTESSKAESLKSVKSVKSVASKVSSKAPSIASSINSIKIETRKIPESVVKIKKRPISPVSSKPKTESIHSDKTSLKSLRDKEINNRKHRHTYGDESKVKYSRHSRIIDFSHDLDFWVNVKRELLFIFVLLK